MDWIDEIEQKLPGMVTTNGGQFFSQGDWDKVSPKDVKRLIELCRSYLANDKRFVDELNSYTLKENLKFKDALTEIKLAALKGDESSAELNCYHLACEALGEE